MYGFSLIRIFPYTSLDYVHLRENVAYRTPFYLNILCSVQLSLLLHCVEQKSSKSFLPYTINEWKKLDPEIIVEEENPDRKKQLLNRLRVDFSHLNEHKLRHDFADTLNPLWSCCLETILIFV